MKQRSFVRHFRPHEQVPATIVDQRRGYLILKHARLQGKAVVATYGIPPCA